MDSLRYQPQVCLALTNLSRLFLQPKLWLALAVAMPCGLIGAATKYYTKYVETNRLDNVITSPAFYNALTFFLAFLVAFRIRNAYRKFWEACDHSYNIAGDICSFASSVVALTRQSPAPAHELTDFYNHLIGLLSLLNATLFAGLECGADRRVSLSDGTTPLAFTMEILGVDGLDGDSLDALISAEEKPEVVYQWVQSFVVDSMHKDLFSGVPSPVVAWSMCELGHAIHHYHDAQKATEVPFPFPYMIALQLLLITHWLTTILVVIEWSNYVWVAGASCFMSVFSLWFFVGLAIDLDMPFGCTRNSIDMRYLQRLLNNRLLTLLTAIEGGTAQLSQNVRREISCENFHHNADKTRVSFSKNAQRRLEEQADLRDAGGHEEAFPCLLSQNIGSKDEIQIYGI